MLTKSANQQISCFTHHKTETKLVALARLPASSLVCRQADLFIFVNKYFAFFNLILKLHRNSNEKMNFWTNFTFWIVLALCVSQGIFNRNSTFIDGKNSNSNQMILYLFNFWNIFKISKSIELNFVKISASCKSFRI